MCTRAAVGVALLGALLVAPVHADRPGSPKIPRLAPSPAEAAIEPHDHRSRISLRDLPPNRPWQERIGLRDTLAVRSVPTKNPVAACDDSGFATKTGSALVDHVRNAPTNPDTNTSCVNRLFDAASDAVRFAAYSEQNMIAVANATASLAASYDGTNSTNLKELYLFLRAGYYVEFYNPDDVQWGSGVGTAMAGAIDAFVASSHYTDDSDAHGEVLGEVHIAMDSSEQQDRYVPQVRDWLTRWNASYAGKWNMRSAVNSLFTLLFRGHQNPAFVSAVANDTNLMLALRDFAASTWMVGADAQFMAENGARELARFLQYQAAPIYSTASSGIQTILSTYSMSGSGAGIWLAAAAGADFYDDCATYDICGFAQQVE
ncbi:MAG: M9 family metallopeptidase N-terminal domain-containing protein, partial [Acidobacteriota bacterium]